MRCYDRILEIEGWKVYFFFSIGEYSTDEILSVLYSVNASDAVIRKISRLIDSGKYNTAFTYSDLGSLTSVVTIGPTTSGKEFMNSFVHEIRHLADMISISVGKLEDTEYAAYLSGDIAMELSDVVCAFSCTDSFNKKDISFI